MKTIIFLLLALSLAILSRGQTASEYYRDPIDTALPSRYLGEKRSISIILPQSFSRSKATKFPLIVVFDRQNKRIFRQTFEAINYLVSFDEMPEAVIIGIATENNQQRVLETSLKASDEKANGENLISFLYQELLPWAEAELNCSSNRVFIGHSRFGYLSSYLLADKLSALTGVISCSPFFLEPHVNVVDSLKYHLEHTPLDHTVYYRFITGDSVTDTREYALMKTFLDRSGPYKNFDAKGTAFYNAKHMAVPGLGVMPSLLELFDYWSDEMSRVLQDKQPFDREVYRRFKLAMKQHYGAEIGLGLAVLNGIGYKFYNQQRYAEARMAWQILLEEYPMFSQAYVSMAGSYVKEGDKKKAQKGYEQAKKALATSNFYNAVQKQALQADIEASLEKLSD